MRSDLVSNSMLRSPSQPGRVNRLNNIVQSCVAINLTCKLKTNFSTKDIPVRAGGVLSTFFLDAFSIMYLFFKIIKGTVVRTDILERITWKVLTYYTRSKTHNGTVTTNLIIEYFGPVIAWIISTLIFTSNPNFGIYV
jgi:hypothetical protein